MAANGRVLTGIEIAHTSASEQAPEILRTGPAEAELTADPPGDELGEEAARARAPATTATIAKAAKAVEADAHGGGSSKPTGDGIPKVAFSSEGAEASSRRPVSNLPPAAPRLNPWPDRLKNAVAWLWERLVRPRVRLTLLGVILLLIGALIVTSSVWTLPLVIVGALMVIIAWVGARLDGHFIVAWGETGTQLSFRAKIKPGQPALPAPPASRGVTAARPEPAPPEPARRDSEPDDAEVVEGEAHTIEIDVAELKALIAAAEAADAELVRKVAPRAASSMRAG